MRASISHTTMTEKPGKAYDWLTHLNGFEAEDLDLIDFVDRIIKGHSFAQVYSGRPSRDRFIQGQVIAVDMDTDDERSSQATLLKHPFVSAYACMVYPTLSHTPDKPRHRVVWVLDEPIAGAEGFEYAAKLVTSFFPDADAQCANAGRSFLGNGKILRDGLDCYFNDCLLPVSHLRVLAKQRMAEQRRLEAAKPPAQRRGYAAPVQEGKQDLFMVMEKLRRLDPYAMGYDEWVRVGMALSREYGDAAFMPFKSWSDKPGHAPLTWAKWQSFAAPHPNPVSMGSVIHTLKMRGVA